MSIKHRLRNLFINTILPKLVIGRYHVIKQGVPYSILNSLQYLLKLNIRITTIGIMEVTQKNFQECLLKIKDHLHEAEFVSFDTELSGLGRSIGGRIHEFDTPAERYAKERVRVMEYGLIQIGISIFRFCPESKKYHTSTYCFFLGGNPEASYRYDASSMNFLASNGFDFNKLFIEGLPFMSLLEEKEVRESRVKKLREENVTPSPVKVTDIRMKQFVKEAMTRVCEAQQKNESVVYPFSSMTAFKRKLLYHNVAPHFPKCAFKSLKNRDLEVRPFASEAEKFKIQDEEWEQELSDKLGFTHVVKALLEANKPLVGHNIFLDIMHFVDKFVAPLPKTYDEFKSLVRANLPPFYDTKLLAKDPPFSAEIMNTALTCLFDELSLKYSPPEVEVEDGCRSYKIAESGQAHDGGYDAFMTGICFITMLKTLEGQKWGKDSIPVKSKCLEVYSSRINFMKSYDIPFLDINSPEVIPDRSFVFTVDCPPAWTSCDVKNLFGVLKAYRTVWANDTFMFVIPQDDSDIAHVKLLLKGLQAASPPNVYVSLYNDKLNKKTNGKPSKTDLELEPSNVKPAMKTGPSVSKRKSNDRTSQHTLKNKERGQTLKRLKSVGSEQLSNLTLDSPVDDGGGGFESSSQKGAVSNTGSKTFAVPDEW